MKLEELETEPVNFSFPPEEQKPPSKDLFKSLIILCPYNNEGAYYCVDCDLNPVICGSKNCECYASHADCEYLQKISKLHKNLNSKLFPKTNINQVTKITDKIKDLVSEFQNKIAEEYEYFGLSKAERKITKLIEGLGRNEPARGKDFEEYRSKRSDKHTNLYEDSMEIFTSIQSTLQQQLSQQLKQIEQAIRQEHMKYMEDFDFSKIDSSIVSTQRELTTMKEMLSEDYRVVSAKKIYTQVYETQGFQTLLKTCHNRSNLLFLVENNENRKFGAFVKCPFPQHSFEWQHDETEESFIFSLDMNVKQYLQNSSQTVEFSDEKGEESITIGGQSWKQAKKRMYIHQFEDTYIELEGYNFKTINGCAKDEGVGEYKYIQVFEVAFRKNQKPRLERLKDQLDETTKQKLKVFNDEAQKIKKMNQQKKDTKQENINHLKQPEEKENPSAQGTDILQKPKTLTITVPKPVTIPVQKNNVKTSSQRPENQVNIFEKSPVNPFANNNHLANPFMNNNVVVKTFSKNNTVSTAPANLGIRIEPVNQMYQTRPLPKNLPNNELKPANPFVQAQKGPILLANQKSSVINSNETKMKINPLFNNNSYPNGTSASNNPSGEFNKTINACQKVNGNILTANKQAVTDSTSKGGLFGKFGPQISQSSSMIFASKPESEGQKKEESTKSSIIFTNFASKPDSESEREKKEESTESSIVLTNLPKKNEEQSKDD